jgi:hypothetical protein
LDYKRGRAVNPNTNEAYFDLVEEIMAGKLDYHLDQDLDNDSGPPADFVPVAIKPENIYSMDESGFFPAGGVLECIIGPRGQQTQHKQSDGGYENTTVMVTICADGTVLHPTVIFKGKTHQIAWNQDNPLESSNLS